MGFSRASSLTRIGPASALQKRVLQARNTGWPFLIAKYLFLNGIEGSSQNHSDMPVSDDIAELLTGWTANKWWARQDLNLGPTDYESKKDRPPLIWDEELSIATTLILFAITGGSDRHRPTTN